MELLRRDSDPDSELGLVPRLVAGLSATGGANRSALGSGGFGRQNNRRGSSRGIFVCAPRALLGMCVWSRGVQPDGAWRHSMSSERVYIGALAGLLD